MMNRISKQILKIEKKKIKSNIKKDSNYSALLIKLIATDSQI